MKAEKILAQLRALPLEVQAAPEYQDLVAKLENPRRLTVEDVEQSHISKAQVHSIRRRRFDGEFYKAMAWVLVELVLMAGLLFHLYGYVDTPLSVLKVGEVADIVVSAGVFGWMFWRAWEAIKSGRE